MANVCRKYMYHFEFKIALLKEPRRGSPLPRDHDPTIHDPDTASQRKQKSERQKAKRQQSKKQESKRQGAKRQEPVRQEPRILIAKTPPKRKSVGRPAHRSLMWIPYTCYTVSISFYCFVICC